MTDVFAPLLAGQELPADTMEQFPFYPLTAAGMPLPGGNFITAAEAMGDPAPVLGVHGKEKFLASHGPALEYLYRRALYDETFYVPVNVRGQLKQAFTLPGHLYGDDTRGLNGGPRRAQVMILGKNPVKEDMEARAVFASPAAQRFFDALDELGVGAERYDYYMTNLVKWPTQDHRSDTLPVAHKKDCDILLQQELRLVRPNYLLCLGSDASKWLLGTQYGVNAMVGRVQEIQIQVNDDIDNPEYHTIKVMAVAHPAAVHRTPELYTEFKSQLGLFVSLVNGAEVGKRETFINHKNVYSQAQLRPIIDEILADPDPMRRVIAVDGEWEGELPQNPGAYLRTVQFSTKHGEGITVVLRHQGGDPAFMPSLDHAIHELKRLLKTDPERGYYPRVGGHFLRADLPWLIDIGLDVREEYKPAATPELCRTQGGWDTGLMYHAVNETASYRLTDMTVRLTQAPVYDARLSNHITGYCKAHDIKKSDLEGYGFLPSWILHPEPTEPEWGDNYASYDADVARRIAIRHLEENGLLDKDWNNVSSWEPYWRSHCASLGVLEMEMNGITFDKERTDQLTVLFMSAHARLLEQFREAINWPDFNPESAPQCVAFLFGDSFSKKRDPETGQKLPIRPQGSVTLNLQPVKSTGKRSKLWQDLKARGETHLYEPSSDKEVLGILGRQHPLAMQLRDLKFITQVLKGPLRRPVVSDASGAWEHTDDGYLKYEKGLAACVHADGKIHTHVSQNKETGRGSTARPPLQNISKRREGDYSRILGTWKTDPETGLKTPKGDYLGVFQQPLYQAPIRTILRASPGHVLVESDYTGAELAVIAWLSNDRRMIEHVRLNALREDHPDHYDMHSHTAVDTFQLACAPTKKGLKEAGFSSLRVAAKNVNFGIPYGRSAEAIERQCREEGTSVSVDDCQRMIEAYFIKYPSVAQFLENCRHRSQNARWLSGSFGRKRRFIATRDPGVRGEQERQAQNFPIQNTVADAVWLAISNFYEYRQQHPEYHYRLLLQIHDALLFEVPIPEVEHFVTTILPDCMQRRVPVWPRYLDGTPMNVPEPYFFGIETEVQINWGESITEAQATQFNIPHSLI